MLKHKFFNVAIVATSLFFAADAAQETRTTQKINDGGERLQSREIFGHFQMNGEGKDANWGFSKEVKFNYEVTVKAKSRIVEKKVFPNGKIRVVEERTFDKYTDALHVNPSVKIDFSTLPVEEFNQAVRAIGTISAYFTAAPGKAVIAEGFVSGVKLLKQQYDGAKLPLDGKTAEQIIEKFNGQLKQKTFVKIRPVEGQTYRITSTQDKKGRPLKVKFERADGKTMSEEEELAIKRCNSFITYNVLPDTNKRVGGNWKVSATDLEEIFDPFMDGKVYGNIVFERKANDNNKNWNVAMHPASLRIRSNGENIGHIDLQSGNAVVEPKKFHNILDMNAKGKVKMDRVTQHHLLFTAKVSSDCSFETRATANIIE